MKRTILLLIISVLIHPRTDAQEDRDHSGIDKMILFGEYKAAIDSCRMILDSDSANAAIWYKMGIASQNLLPDTGSFNCFLRAMSLKPENNLYKFSVAKSYYNKGRNNRARPLFRELCESDSLNWDYAYYLSSVFMDEGQVEKALEIYEPFYNHKPDNYVILDKIGFANLRKGDFETAAAYYDRSLKINPENTDAVRNLSFLYPYLHKTDSALTLLSRYIERDPEDIDLIARRATIYYSKNYFKRALNDYLKILTLGDSSFLYLKRAGIGYVNNLQPKQGLNLLLKATVIDTTDYETVDYIAQCYFRLDQLDKSITYYQKVVDILNPLAKQLGITHLNLGQKMQTLKDHENAIDSYVRSYELTHNPSLLMLIANVYDETLQDSQRAITYYKQYLSAIKEQGGTFTAEYLNSIRSRIEYLEKKQSGKPAAIPKSGTNLRESMVI